MSPRPGQVPRVFQCSLGTQGRGQGVRVWSSGVSRLSLPHPHGHCSLQAGEGPRDGTLWMALRPPWPLQYSCYGPSPSLALTFLGSMTPSWTHFPLHTSPSIPCPLSGPLPVPPVSTGPGPRARPPPFLLLACHPSFPSPGWPPAPRGSQSEPSSLPLSPASAGTGTTVHPPVPGTALSSPVSHWPPAWPFYTPRTP